MDSNQPTAPFNTTTTIPPSSYTPQPQRGMFGTNIPSVSAFAVGIILFLLPFSEIKCGGQSLTNKSGLSFATGSDWKPAGGYGKEFMGEMANKTTGSKEGNAQIFAIVALAAGVIGLIVSFLKSRNTGYIGVIAGLVAAGGLVALMMDLKKWFKDLLAKEAVDAGKTGAEGLGLDKLGDQMQATMAMTPWFYISIIAFVAAAFFSYRWVAARKL